jgi:hypothetical protein
MDGVDIHRCEYYRCYVRVGSSFITKAGAWVSPFQTYDSAETSDEDYDGDDVEDEDRHGVGILFLSVNKWNLIRNPSK